MTPNKNNMENNKLLTILAEVDEGTKTPFKAHNEILSLFSVVNMTPEEKAKEIISKYKDYYDYDYMDRELSDYLAREYALICANEVLSQLESVNKHLPSINEDLVQNVQFWQNVKKKLTL